MKLNAFKEIDEIDEQISRLLKSRAALLSNIQSICTHPNQLFKALNGGPVEDEYGRTGRHIDPTNFECGLCGLFIEVKK